jgi:hypothetical protein
MGSTHWDSPRGPVSRLSRAGSSALRVVLLFGTLAVALALIAAPVIDQRVKTYISRTNVEPKLDYTATGSIGYKGSYTIRKSVLQGSPNSVCILRDNGTKSGDC